MLKYFLPLKYSLTFHYDFYTDCSRRVAAFIRRNSHNRLSIQLGGFMRIGFRTAKNTMIETCHLWSNRHVYVISAYRITRFLRTFC